MSSGNFYALCADNDHKRWLSLLEQSSHREVFAHPDYLRLFSEASDSCVCLVYEGKGFQLMYPILLRDLSKLEYFETLDTAAVDAVSPPYGYCGPFLSGPESGREELIRKFYASYKEWADQHSLVSEYVSFSPKRSVGRGYEGKSSERCPTVLRRLDMSADELWMDYKGSIRTDVKAARRNGVSVISDATGQYASDFLAIYSSTMDRRSAVTSYQLDMQFLEQIHKKLTGYFIYFHAYHEGKIVSTELVLLSGNSSFFFRGGTYRDQLKTKANVMLKHEIISWSQERGLDYYLLGGGNSAEDSLFKYKKAFAPRGVETLMVGKWTVDGKAMSDLVQRRKDYERDRGVEWQASETYFPPYRS